MNGRGTLVFVNVNDLAWFAVGDLDTGKVLHRIEFEDYRPGALKRHGCPSHGIALTPDERELWVVDGASNSVHVFDAAVMPPRQTAIIGLRDFPGWISFSIDGRHTYLSTGDTDTNQGCCNADRRSRSRSAERKTDRAGF
jgi:DNA-binding beta-propeller fold protein YncE